MKQCSACKIELVDEAVFCTVCGNKCEEIVTTNINNINSINNNEEIICKNCGKEREGTLAFCIYCGLKFEETETKDEKREVDTLKVNEERCKNCNEILEENMDFCIFCGTTTKDNELIITDTIKENVKEIKPEVKIQEKNEEQKKIIEITNKVDENKFDLDDKIINAKNKKSNAIFNLGLAVYEDIRAGKLKNERLEAICEGIIGFDYIIYNTKLELNDLHKIKPSIQCTCGNELKEKDKFCNECGKKVIISQCIKNNITCSKCDVIVDKNDVFCGCCGYKILN